MIEFQTLIISGCTANQRHFSRMMLKAIQYRLSLLSSVLTLTACRQIGSNYATGRTSLPRFVRYCADSAPSEHLTVSRSSKSRQLRA